MTEVNEEEIDRRINERISDWDVIFLSDQEVDDVIKAVFLEVQS